MTTTRCVIYAVAVLFLAGASESQAQAVENFRLRNQGPGGETFSSESNPSPSYKLLLTEIGEDQLPLYVNNEGLTVSFDRKSNAYLRRSLDGGVSNLKSSSGESNISIWDLNNNGTIVGQVWVEPWGGRSQVWTLGSDTAVEWFDEQPFYEHLLVAVDNADAVYAFERGPTDPEDGEFSQAYEEWLYSNSPGSDGISLGYFDDGVNVGEKLDIEGAGEGGVFVSDTYYSTIDEWVDEFRSVLGPRKALPFVTYEGIEVNDAGLLFGTTWFNLEGTPVSFNEIFYGTRPLRFWDPDFPNQLLTFDSRISPGGIDPSVGSPDDGSVGISSPEAGQPVLLVAGRAFYVQRPREDEAEPRSFQRFEAIKLVHNADTLGLDEIRLRGLSDNGLYAIAEGWTVDGGGNAGESKAFLVEIRQVDLDVDSDNDGVVRRSVEEEEGEAPDANSPDVSSPGKVIFVNAGDADNDGVPDFADGLNIFEDQGTHASVIAEHTDSKPLVPMVLELPDDGDVRVRFRYSASDPASIVFNVDASGRNVFETAPGQLRIWKKDGDELRNVEPVDVSSGDFVAPDVVYSREDLGFLNGETSQTLYVESMRPSVEVAGDRVAIDVWFDIPPDEATEPEIVEEVAFTGIAVRMVADYDRNGSIEHYDLEKSDRGDPFYFWVNDDDDDPDKETKGDDIPGQNGNSDAARSELTHFGQIDGTRDLIDFFPVYCDFENLLTYFDPKDLAFRLHGVDVNYLEVQAANPFGWGFGPNTVGSYQRMAERASWFGDASVRSVFSDLLEWSPYLSSEFIEQAVNGNGTLLMEGAKATSGSNIKIQVLRKGNVIGEVQLSLVLSEVEDMFRHVNLTNKGFGENETATRVYATSSGGPPGFPDKVTNGKNFIFVHGYNVNNQGARGTFSEVFKRLYWSGSNARFIGVSWHGFSSKNVTLGIFTPDYHENVINALETAPYFKEAVGVGLPSFIGGGETIVCAHSLGNMLVSQAIVEHGYDPDYYFMVDAAVALEAYNGSRSVATGIESMEEPKWRAYTSKELLASNWSDLFSDSAIDPRKEFKWTGFFSGIQQGYNFFSSGEEVLESNKDGAIPPLTNPLSPFGRSAWVIQEIVKGTILAGLATHDISAGWGFNYRGLYDEGGWNVISEPIPGEEVRVPMTQEQLDQLGLSGDELKERLRTVPFFRDFQASDSDEQFDDYNGLDLMAELDSQLALQTASIPIVMHKVLAEGIPALSYPAGSNEISVFNNIDIGRNIDMNLEFQVEWPDERDDILDNGVNYRWRHGDFVDIAYPYVFRLYDSWVAISGLNEK